MLGAFFLYGAMITDTAATNPDNLKTVSGRFHHLVNVKGHRGDTDYRLTLKEYPTTFKIPKGILIDSKNRNILENMTEGTLVSVQIRKGSDPESADQVRAFSLASDQPVYDLETYNTNWFKYQFRWQLVFIFGSAMLFANGLRIFTSTHNKWAVGMVVGAVILMRIFDFGIY